LWGISEMRFDDPFLGQHRRIYRAKSKLLLPKYMRLGGGGVIRTLLTPVAVNANNTAIDGTPVNSVNVAPLTLPNLTTTVAGKVIVFFAINGSFVGASVSGSTLGSFNVRAGAPPAQNILEFEATSSGALVNEVITITCPASPGGFCEGTAFGVKGVNTGVNGGFDSNGSLPIQNGTSPITVPSTSANCMMLSSSRNGGITTADTTDGWVQVGTGSFLLVQSKKVTSPQSLNASDPSGTSNGMIGDALVSN
jgi:hypothetical protein